MTFYSGFSLKNESYLFKNYIDSSQYCVCGFSYGAIKAYEHVNQHVKNGKRVDTLQLFSPAFFQTKPTKFKRVQTLSYKKNKDAYLREFISSCFSPHEKKIIENVETNSQELEELLNYVWDIEALKELQKNGVKIEVYIGAKDEIIDAESAKDFFLHVATLTYIKDANHFLQIK